jgi:hypothetical protein
VTRRTRGRSYHVCPVTPSVRRGGGRHHAKSLNFNAVIVQIRPHADAFWPSPLEPWSQYLTGVAGRDPGWDPLAYLVSKAHEQNLEFHAWFNPYRASMPAPGGAGTDLSKLPENNPLRLHPDWAVPYPADNAAGRLYFDPGIPEGRLGRGRGHGRGHEVRPRRRAQRLGRAGHHRGDLQRRACEPIDPIPGNPTAEREATGGTRE